MEMHRRIPKLSVALLLAALLLAPQSVAPASAAKIRGTPDDDRLTVIWARG